MSQTKSLDSLAADEELQKSLYKKISLGSSAEVSGRVFRNTHVAELSESHHETLFSFLLKSGTFDFNFEKISWKDIDGEESELTINRASKTHMWPMGTNFWVRDNAIIGARLLNLDYHKNSYPKEWKKFGKEVLLSTLTIMSSTAQLRRFETIISGENSHHDPINWPHIFLTIDDNLNAAKDEPWMHKQDAWQIICYYTLEAIEKGLLDKNDLTEKHKKLLQLICPFLEAIDFTNCPNGGSWEEIDSIRTSVIAWETALLYKVAQSPHFSHVDASRLFDQGVSKLRENIPFESPNYEKTDTRYREADASLIYLLILDVFRFFPENERQATLESTLAQIESLVGKSGIKRYKNDSYQGLSYYTNEVSAKLRQMYDSPSGDSSGIEQFEQRYEIVPTGAEAEWTHFVWQLSHALGKLAKVYSDNKLKEKQNYYFHFGLSLITGEKEYTIQEGQSLQMGLSSCQAFQLPECYNSEKYGEIIFQYPSMHTPLYWSIAECVAAFDQQV